MLYPRQRLDALTDGIYGVAMTLLVLDIRIPDTAVINSNSELIGALTDLWPKALPYAISFIILAWGWLSSIRIRAEGERASKRYARWWLLQLLLVTCVPFSNILLGRYSQFPIAVALYAANIGLMALCSQGMLRHFPEVIADDNFNERQVSLRILVACSVLVIALSPLIGPYALYAFLLNFAVPFVAGKIKPQAHTEQDRGAQQ